MTRRPRLSDDDVRTAHARYYGDGQRGEKPDLVARAYGVSPSTLTRRFNLLALPHRQRGGVRQPLTDAELADAMSSLCNGATMEQVAVEHWMNVTTLRKQLRAAGFETDWRKRAQQEATQ